MCFVFQYSSKIENQESSTSHLRNASTPYFHSSTMYLPSLPGKHPTMHYSIRSRFTLAWSRNFKAIVYASHEICENGYTKGRNNLKHKRERDIVGIYGTGATPRTENISFIYRGGRELGKKSPYVGIGSSSKCPQSVRVRNDQEPRSQA